MNDISDELRQITRFSLRGLLLAVAACAIEAAAVVYISPFWWLMSVVVLAALVAASARRLNHANPVRRAAHIAIIVIGGFGFVHLAIARFPWTGSWLLRLTWEEVTAGNGWFTPYMPSALGSHYTLCWTVAAVVGGCAARLVVATKNWMRRR
ncbi:MAG TPA: hypothetical protein VN699_07005 [Pirellulales bacterium]|nr:hypothetical protein [Pirellulales bacterium]